MNKLLTLNLSMLVMLLGSSLATAEIGKKNSSWCNKTNGDFAGDCKDPDIHCAPGWGLKEGTCEYKVKGTFINGNMKTNRPIIQKRKSKPMKG